MTPYMLSYPPLSSLASGAYITTFVVPIYGFGEMKDVGKRIGMSMTVGSFAALAGPPIAGALIKSFGYSAAGYFGGTFQSFQWWIPIEILITRILHAYRGNSDLDSPPSSSQRIVQGKVLVHGVLHYFAVYVGLCPV